MNEQEVENIIKKQMEENHGIVKKEVLTKQGIDYRRINQLVKDGKLARIKNGYYTDRIDDFSEDALVVHYFRTQNCVWKVRYMLMDILMKSLMAGLLQYTRIHQKQDLKWIIQR